MKLSAEQQARLDALMARDDLSAAEQAELAFLQNLAAQAEDGWQDDGGEAAEGSEAEDEIAGGEASGEDSESEEETSSPGAIPAPAAKKPNVFERAMQRVQSRSALLANLSNVRDELATVTAERDRLLTENADLRQRAEAGEAFAGRVAELESERHTVSQAAARIAASSHVAPEELPETSEEEVETLDSVREKLATETDPKERSRLAKKARALRNASATASLN